MTSRARRAEHPTLALPLDVADSSALPRHLAPMQPRLAAAPFNSEEFLFEVKWDGVRALVTKDSSGLRVTDRHGDDLLARLPELSRAARQLPDGVLIDAEVVVCDKRGRPRYELLAARLGRAGRRAGHGPLLLGFDLLYEGSRPLMNRPLVERRERLARAVSPGGPLLVPEHLESDGEPFFEAVQEFELEGIVAKRRGAPYVPGARSADWLKLHTTPRLDAVVCGAIVDSVVREVLCGAYREGTLAYVGRAYVPPFLREYVAEHLRGLEVDASPIDGPVELRSGLRWLRPERCAIVEHTGRDGTLSSDARFRAFRLDARPEDCRLEEPIRMPSGEPKLERDRPRLVVLRSLFPREG